jgi:hypothetical protein
MHRIRRWGLGALIGILVGGPALALGPISGEVGAVWWANDFDSGGVSEDAGAPGLRAELWYNDYGVRAMHFSSDLDEIDLDTSDYTSIDVMWKPFAPTENNFIAVGVGWEQVDFTNLDLDDDTSGVRLSVEGRVGLIGMLYAYGHAAYLPSLDDTPSRSLKAFDFEYQDMEGLEYELGVQFQPLPFMSIRAGYRETSVDFTLVDQLLDVEVDSDTAESSGVLAGVGFHF